VKGLIFSDEMARIDWSEVSSLRNSYGVKAASSLAVPRAWTPSFALVPSTIVASVGTASSLSSVLGDAEVDRILTLATSNSTLIIRSSVIGESIWDRGTYRSVVMETSGGDAIERLNTEARSVIGSAGGRAIGLMIQRYIQPVSQGEFGNLQRISKTRDHWEVSTADGVGSTSIQRLNSQRDQAADPNEPLSIRSGLARERLFGSIGAWLNNELMLGRSQRLNCEWITDNRKFFLVQIDEEDEDIRGVNPFQVRIPPAIRPTGDRGHHLQLTDTGALKSWDKLKVLEDLWEPDAPHKPILFFVPLSKLPAQVGTIVLRELEDDFRTLIGPAGIIVRTSVRAGGEKLPNLPRTECLTPAAAASWCIETAEKLSKVHDRFDIAFVAHRFVASRASAWARAEPGNPIVEIHSLWGLPDALQYCPYDIWEVHLPTGVATDYPDYKAAMLISRTDGSWEYVRVKNELARVNCITSGEAKDIAVRSMTIADRLGRACHIMWFIGCVETDGTPFNIPWYWTEAHLSERNHDRASYRVFVISGPASLTQFIELGGPRTRQAIALRPTELELMRDTDFIAAVGNAAKSADIPVILSGSTLAHAYYQLRKIGCTIVTPTEKDHFRVRRSVNFGKLVRDKIPAKIAARREVELTRKIPGRLRMGFLISKLLEEALEVREAVEANQKMEELADLFEVFRAMATAEGVSLEAIRKAAEEKKQKSGGFEEGLILLQTGISVSDRNPIADLERSIGDVLADQTSDEAVEIPFSFFGFMKLDQPRSVYFDKLKVRLDIILRPDRLDLKLIRTGEQLRLPLTSHLQA
jgi:predicted house-cleaning noncanonical NTP pyrophosphatase (MazG superfamily)